MSTQPFAALSSVISSIMNSFFSMAMVAAMYVGLWFTFRKMYLPGWKGIIPFYNFYIMFEKLWDLKQFWRMVIYTAVCAASAIIGSALSAVGGLIAAGSGDQAVAVVLLILGGMLIIGCFVMAILLIVLEFQLFVRLAAAFGLKRAWAWGLLFVPYVFFPLIGFHKNITYYGPVNQV